MFVCNRNLAGSQLSGATGRCGAGVDKLTHRRDFATNSAMPHRVGACRSAAMDIHPHNASGFWTAANADIQSRFIGSTL